MPLYIWLMLLWLAALTGLVALLHVRMPVIQFKFKKEDD